MHINEIEVKSVMTKSNLPAADFSVNPYVGYTHVCRYCCQSCEAKYKRPSALLEHL